MKNQKIECKCTDMTVDGLGICKYDSLVIFVKQMLIDEVAIVKIISHKKNLAYGIIDTMIKPSKYRIASPCKVAYKCGGCDLRHVDYNYGLKLKRDILDSTMNKMAKLDVKVKDITPSPLIDGYRNKVQIPVKERGIGFYRKNSNDIVEFDKCFVQSEIENKILNRLKELIKEYSLSEYLRHIITKEVMVALVTKTFNLPHINTLVAMMVEEFPMIKSFILNLKHGDDNVVLGDEEKVLYGSSYIIDSFGGIEVAISLKSFYQVNHGQMLNLYTKVLNLANVDSNTKVLDLFSGIGTISLFMAKHVKEVTGVEIVREAVDDAKWHY